jgi:hypothetical protein
MATTDISVVNGALIMVGADDINTLNDNTMEAKLAKSVYTDTKQMLLQYYPWRFSLKQIDLGGALVAPPLFAKWKYKYKLPADTLRIISLENEEDYEVFEDEVYTNVNPCRIIYQFKISETDMPSYFIRSLQFHLARIFSISLQEDKSKMDIFDKMADKETARARQIDAQQQPNPSIPERNYSLLNIRG